MVPPGALTVVGGPADLRLAGFLSSTETRSGQSIAAELGCSRTAVWKQVGALRALGVGIDAVPGQGYRLREALELLDRERILAAMGASRAALGNVRVLATCDSTNDVVRQLGRDEAHGAAVLAERQTAGRGRHGRRWHSPFARNLYLSLGWIFERGVAELGGLPLVVALAATRAIRGAGLRAQGVKWPNDLVVDGRKLGGCLVEIQGDANGPCRAVMGIGINVHMPADSQARELIDQPWTDLGSALGAVSRNALAAAVLAELLQSMQRFEAHGFGVFRPAWRRADALRGRRVSVQQGGARLRGVAGGVSERGGLWLDVDGRRQEVLAGEASLLRAGRGGG